MLTHFNLCLLDFALYCSTFVIRKKLFLLCLTFNIKTMKRFVLLLSILGFTSHVSEIFAQEKIVITDENVGIRVEGATIGAPLNTDAVPLCVVDGRVIPYEDLTNINSEDIVSVTVLKAAQAAEKYSHLGDVSNGVLVVELTEVEEVFISTDVMPTFMNGDLLTFQEWVMQNIRYPAAALEANIQGVVVVSFVVGSDGYISTDRTEVLQSPNDLLKNEVLRVINLSPRWTPAMQAGKNVAVVFTMPVVFSTMGADAK